MAANIFEIIVRKGFDPYDITVSDAVVNGEFNTFVNNPYWGMWLPAGYSFEGLSQNMSEDSTSSTLGIFYNADFTEDWSNPTSIISDVTTYASFHEPQGWAVTMFSVANSGRNAPNTLNTEDDSTCGYFYYQGNAHELSPALNYVSRDSVGTTEKRINGIDDFSYIPTATAIWSGTGLEDTADGLQPTTNVSFGSIQGLNVFPTNDNRFVRLASGRIMIFDSAAKAQFFLLYGFNTLYSSNNYLLEGVNGFSDPTNIEDKWFFDNVIFTRDGYYSSGDAYGNTNIPINLMAPIMLRFKDLFNAEDLGKYVTVKTTFLNGSGNYTLAQELTGCYGTNGYNTDGDQVESSAVAFSVNTTSGEVTGTTVGSFYPNIIHPEMELAANYTDMTDTIYVTGDRLVINKTNPNLDSSMIAQVLLSPHTSYRIFFNVAAVSGDIPINFTVHLFFENDAGDWQILAAAPNNTTSDDFGIDFDTNEKTNYRIQIASTGGLNGSVQFGAIRLSVNTCGIYETVDFDTYAIGGKKSVSNPFVITTSDFTKDPDSQFGNTEIEGNQGVDVFKYYDIDDNVEVAFTADAYTSMSSSGYTVIDTREFCNPYTVGTLGTPMVKENESHKFAIKDVAIKDPHGFFYADDAEEEYEVVSTIKIGSPHLNLYQDTFIGGGLISSEYGISGIEFGTCESSFISRADSVGDGSGSGLDKLHLYYDPNPSFPSYQTSNITPPPEAMLLTPIHTDIIMGAIPLTIGYKVDSLAGDPVILDFGAGTNTITISAAGTGSTVIVPNGNNLRIRTQTAAEKGSAVSSVDAVIDYVSLAVTITGTLLLAEKYGDEWSNNSSLPDIGEYDASLRVYSVDASTLALANSAGGVQMFKNIYGLEDSSEVILKINVLSLGTGNSLSVIESFSGVEVTTSITSTGETTITYINTPEESVSDVLEFIFLSDGSNPLDIKITSISVETTSLSSANLSMTTIDLYDDFEMPINLSVKDFTELSSGSGDYTKTLTVPATKNNMDAVDFIGNINSMHNKETAAGFPCIVKAEGLPIFEGALHLTETDLDEHGEVELKFNILGGNALWVDALRSLNIQDLDSNEYPISSHSIIYIDGTSSDVGMAYPDGSVEAEAAFAEYLNPSIDTEILFPLVNNGRWFTEFTSQPNRTAVGWDNVKASYRIKNVLDKIFKSIGYTLSSTFINGETDWSAEFSSEFYSMFSNIIGIAPSMSVRDSDIINSEIDLQTLTLQESAYKTGALGSTTTPRPTLSSEMLNTEAGTPAQTYYCDWVYLKFETTNVDRSSNHSLNTISGHLGNCGFGNTDSDTYFKNQSGDVNTTYSTIRVGRSGYYDLNVSVKGDFNVAIDDTFYNAIEDEGNSFGNAEGKFTVALIADNMALDDLYKTPSSMGALLFDLYDKGWVRLNAKNYDNTRLNLTKVQYLEAHKDYNIVAISAIKDQLIDDLLLGDYGTTFELLEVDFNLKLSKEVAPMKGRNNIVYTDVSTPRVTYAEVLPDVTALDFISELSKIFNLVWTTNSTTKIIEVEPYEDFFDLQGEGDSTPYKDWSDKAVIKNVKENGVLDSDLIYKMASDSSDYSVNLSQSGLSLGDKQISSNRATNAFAKDKEKEYKLDIFSALAMDWDTHLVKNAFDDIDGSERFYPIFLPKIWSKPSSTLYPELNEQKPDPNNEHNHKLAYVGQRYIAATSQPLNSYSDLEIYDEVLRYNLEGIWTYGDYSSDWGTLSGGRFRTQSYLARTYLQASSYSPVGSDLPNLTFADSLGATSSEGGLYNVYHQPLVEMLMMRDKLITADVNLSAGDIDDINFRQLINIDGNLYIINKIKDFNFSGEPTEVELLLVTPRGLKEKIK